MPMGCNLLLKAMLHVNPFLLDYPFSSDVASMRSLLFTNCSWFDTDSLYGQIGLSHDKTLPVFVNEISLQMATSSITHRQYFHVIFHVL